MFSGRIGGILFRINGILQYYGFGITALFRGVTSRLEYLRPCVASSRLWWFGRFGLGLSASSRRTTKSLDCKPGASVCLSPQTKAVRTDWMLCLNAAAASRISVRIVFRQPPTATATKFFATLPAIRPKACIRAGHRHFIHAARQVERVRSGRRWQRRFAPHRYWRYALSDTAARACRFQTCRQQIAYHALGKQGQCVCPDTQTEYVSRPRIHWGQSRRAQEDLASTSPFAANAANHSRTGAGFLQFGQ